MAANFSAPLEDTQITMWPLVVSLRHSASAVLRRRAEVAVVAVAVAGVADRQGAPAVFDPHDHLGVGAAALGQRFLFGPLLRVEFVAVPVGPRFRGVGDGRKRVARKGGSRRRQQEGGRGGARDGQDEPTDLLD